MDRDQRELGETRIEATAVSRARAHTWVGAAVAGALGLVGAAGAGEGSARIRGVDAFTA